MDPFDQFAPAPLPPDALCAQTDPEAFFPDKGNKARRAQVVARLAPLGVDVEQIISRQEAAA